VLARRSVSHSQKLAILHDGLCPALNETG